MNIHFLTLTLSAPIVTELSLDRLVDSVDFSPHMVGTDRLFHATACGCFIGEAGAPVVTHNKNVINMRRATDVPHVCS